MSKKNVFVVSRTKRKNKLCWSVRSSKRVHAKCTTLAKARSQKRLLSALIYNPGFKRSGKRRTVRRKGR